MRERTQKSSSTAKRLFSVAAYTVNSSPLRYVFVILGVYLFVALSSWAGYNEGFAAYTRGDYTTALQHWQPLADQGNASAQSWLGRMYRLSLIHI